MVAEKPLSTTDRQAGCWLRREGAFPGNLKKHTLSSHSSEGVPRAAFTASLVSMTTPFLGEHISN